MLKIRATEFLAYCKVVGFSPKSCDSLAASLREFDAFINTQPIDSPEDITYGLLADFVADFRGPSVHKKKARVWCLHQFFHFLATTGVVRENIAIACLIPKENKQGCCFTAYCSD